jgi:hypothetical protein
MRSRYFVEAYHEPNVIPGISGQVSMALLKGKVFSFETKAGATATLQASSPPQGQVGQVFLEVHSIVI